VTRDRSAGELAPGFLDPAEEVEHPAGEEHRGCRIVRRQRAVGEVVLITGVEEQLGVVDGLPGPRQRLPQLAGRPASTALGQVRAMGIPTRPPLRQTLQRQLNRDRICQRVVHG
jgi:hypothetical protein